MRSTPATVPASEPGGTWSLGYGRPSHAFQRSDARLLGITLSILREPYGAGVADGDADAEPDAPAEPDGEGETDGVGDGDGDGVSDTAGIEGSGIGVGSGTKRDGTPRIDRTITSTKMAMTARIHGRARRSCLVGRAPR